MNKEAEIRRFIDGLEVIADSDTQDEEILKKKQDQEQWLNRIFEFIKTDKFELAKQLYYQVILDKNGNAIEYWLSVESAIMDLTLKIVEAESKQGLRSFLLLFESLEQIKEFYYRFKFLLRRFEFDLSDELKEEFIDFVEQYEISEWTLIEMVRFDSYHKVKVLNEVAVFLMQHEKYDYVIPLLMEAINNSDADIITENKYKLNSQYNLAYILALAGERELALSYLGEGAKEEYIKTGIDELINAVDILTDCIIQGKNVPAYNELYSMQWENKFELPKVKVPEHKEQIAFIMAVNKEWYFTECCHYINNLYIPEGYKIEILPMRGEKSILSAYQTAMKQTDAKYKIYLHQDGMCVNPYMLYEAISVFEKDSTIGLLGVAGSRSIPATGIWWEGPLANSHFNLYQDSVMAIGVDNYFNSSQRYEKKDYDYMSALDGVFLMTSRDINWREDLFTGWHIYDVSQCMEFIRAGYHCAVAKPKHRIWIWHNDRYSSELGMDYHRERLKFLKEYIGELAKE